MLHDESNGDASFEIINKKNLETESHGNPSSINVRGMSQLTGNLLSNVQPPSGLPDFKLWSSPQNVEISTTVVPQSTVGQVPVISSGNSNLTNDHVAVPPVTQAPQKTVADNQLPSVANQFPTTEFSAAIPPSKGFQYGPSNQSQQNETSSSGGFMDFFKEALSTGVLSKVAEKAKNSVDTIITTLDPQMSEYIYSGGDTEVTVTSENEEEVGAIREAFHSVFGKAWVNGIKLNMTPQKMQAVGFEEGIKNAEERIEYSLKYRKTPTVAIENILFKPNENWYDMSLFVLKDPDNQIRIELFGQSTPVPAEDIKKRIEKERAELNSLSIEEQLASYLKTTLNWQTNVTGLTRKEMLLVPAKSLVKMYKNKLSY